MGILRNIPQTSEIFVPVLYEMNVQRGHKGFPGLYLPQFGDPDWDETELAVRVDCVEGDEEIMRACERELSIEEHIFS